MSAAVAAAAAATPARSYRTPPAQLASCAARPETPHCSEHSTLSLADSHVDSDDATAVMSELSVNAGPTGTYAGESGVPKTGLARPPICLDTMRSSCWRGKGDDKAVAFLCYGQRVQQLRKKQRKSF